MNTLERTAQSLSTVSRQCQQNLLQGIDWPQCLRASDWVMSPELTSLYGTPFYEHVDRDLLPRYLLLEAVNFFSLNIHGERHLMAGIAHRLHGEYPPAVNQYLHHFLDEENKHMAYFAEFCMRYAGFTYPDRSLVFPREFALGEEEILFFGKALLFEELVDEYNAHMARDARLCPVARQINDMHHRDESRHRAFGRRLLVQLFERYTGTWSEATLSGVRAYLAAYLVETWKSLYNSAVYHALGFENPLGVRDAVWQSSVARQHRQSVSRGCVRFLCQHGILQEEPCL
jgi:P-aminobenzoate N-oxygenase AurF